MAMIGYVRLLHLEVRLSKADVDLNGQHVAGVTGK